ncbi:MAG TPA: MlaD family protein [Pyrinomonadaceae bacterium]|jgi:phospholipid/cholesterol/gamma-HCH transport system substrate-binding protein
MPPAKQTIGLREVRVGLLVIISVVVLILLILNASGDISFARKLHVRARFASADGLRPGAEVRLAGVRVGKVDEVRLLPSDSDPNRRVETTLSLDNKVNGRPVTELIRTDSKAQLTSPSLLGSDKIINILPGSNLGEPVREGTELDSTQSAGFDQLTANGNDLVQQLTRLSQQFNEITDKINKGQGTLGRFVNDEAFYDNLNRTVRETQDLMGQIRTGQGTAGRLVNDPALYNNLNDVSLQLKSISEDLRRGRGTAGRLLTDEALYNDARAAIARLNRAADDITAITTDIRAGRGTAGRLLTDEALYNDARAAIARFNTTAERIDTVVAGIQRGEGTAGKLVTDEQLYNNVNQLSAESVKLLYDFRQNPKKYLTIKFSIF